MTSGLRAVAILAAVLGLAAACDRPAPTRDDTNASGAVVPGSAARLAEAIDSMKGRPVVVNYWATWCEPCKEEMPRLTTAAARYGRRVGFVGVNVEDDRSAAAAFARRYRIPFRSYAMTRVEAQRAQRILGLPVTQFYGVDGELAFVNQGEISAQELTDKIDELLLSRAGPADGRGR